MDFVSFMVDVMLPISYILFAVAIVLALLVGPVMSILANPRGVVRGGVALAAMAIVFGVSWAMASDVLTPMYINKNISATVSKLIEGGLNTFYVMFAVSLVGIVVSEITKLFK